MECSGHFIKPIQPTKYMLNNLLSKFSGNGEPAKEIQPSSQPVNGKISYKFQCGIEAHQEELNLEQDEKLTGVLLGFDMGSFSLEATSIKDLIGTLVREKSLLKILDIILIPEGSDKPDYAWLKNSELQNVFGDFFSLNPTAINWLKTIGAGLTSLPQTPSTGNSSKQ
jgi:hypothetical protein